MVPAWLWSSMFFLTLFMLGLNSVIAGLEGANTGILDVLESGLKLYEIRNKISFERLTFNSKEVSWMDSF